jgi:hypothetical protein
MSRKQQNQGMAFTQSLFEDVVTGRSFLFLLNDVSYLLRSIDSETEKVKHTHLMNLCLFFIPRDVLWSL